MEGEGDAELRQERAFGEEFCPEELQRMLAEAPRPSLLSAPPRDYLAARREVLRDLHEGIALLEESRHLLAQSEHAPLRTEQRLLAAEKDLLFLRRGVAGLRRQAEKLDRRAARAQETLNRLAYEKRLGLERRARQRMEELELQIALQLGNNANPLIAERKWHVRQLRAQLGLPG